MELCDSLIVIMIVKLCIYIYFLVHRFHRFQNSGVDVLLSVNPGFWVPGCQTPTTIAWFPTVFVLSMFVSSSDHVF